MDAPFSEMVLLGIPAIPERRVTDGLGVSWIYGWVDGEPCAACAVGTGFYAAKTYLAGALQRWPILKKEVRNPISGTVAPLYLVASNLYEAQKLSREEVAAFIAEKEKEQDQEQKAAVLGVGVA